MNDTVDIVLKDDHLRPFAELEGDVRWSGPERPAHLELRLFWMTRGRGTGEVGVIARKEIHGIGREEPFRFELPAAPYSCSGRLVSVVWALELVDDDGDAVATREFTMSPTGRELELGHVERPRSKAKLAFGIRRQSP